VNPSSKVILEHSFFFGHQTEHIFYSRAVLLGFCTCFHILSFNCQGFSDHLGLLAVRLNELEKSLVYNSKI